MRKSNLLKFILVAFGVILISQQVFNYIYIKRLDKQYSDIIRDKLEILRSFALLSNQSASLQRAMNQMIRFNVKDYDSVTKQVSQGSSNIQRLISKMKEHAVSDEENANIDSLGSVFGTYIAKCNSDIAIVKTTKVDSETSAKLLSGLREVYLDFTGKQLTESNYFIGNGERVSNEITANTDKTSVFLFFVGILPFVVMLMMLIMAALILFVLGYSLDWFRHLE